jgi:alpha-tubulin suppressor-like RCC1 family protein
MGARRVFLSGAAVCLVFGGVGVGCGHNVAAVSVGSAYACALVTGGVVECWGANGSGNLGDGTTTSSPTPVAVSGLSAVTSVSAGGTSACALLADTTVRCWGDNGDGELGDGTTTSSSTPVPVSGLRNVTAISVGDFSACALLSDTTVQCWGSNFYGGLGNGTTPLSTVPVAVTGLTGATAISVSGLGACALLAGGTVECWGADFFGLLGDGGTSGSRSTVPATIPGLTGVTAISVGEESACALLAGGTIECWGEDGSGQLGNGTTAGVLPPVAVSGITNATAIAVGGGHAVGSSACAILANGAVRCWGFNRVGELGDGTTTSSSVPVAVRGLIDPTAISVGEDGTVCTAVAAEATVFCWGSDTGGQLGTGATTNSTVPVPLVWGT